MMLSSLVSIPSTLASSTVSFLSNRKKTFAYLGATAGGAYALGQWGLQRVMEASERGRKESGAKNDLLHRFNLNLQDSQFTVLALLPTIATQLQESLDVEERTTQLGEIAKSERKQKLDELERRRRIEEEEVEEKRRSELASEPEGYAVKENGEVETTDGEQQKNGYSEQPEKSETTTEKEIKPDSTGLDAAQPPILSSKPSLNPDAPAFQPRSLPSIPSQTVADQETFPRLNGHVEATPTEAGKPNGVNGDSHKQDGEEKREEQVESEEGESSGLGKSWAQIVKSDNAKETAGNGEAAEVASEESVTEKKPYGDAGKEALPNANDQVDALREAAWTEKVTKVATEPEQAPTPSKSKGQLWSEIKILSFTRLFTSIYVLSLLTLQTHVQLALLGRAHYVKSLVDSLPPRSPSPSSRFDKGKGKEVDSDSLSMSNEDDLEAALYAEKAEKPREEDRVNEDVERKYLTFSWWLLHEGWKVVQQRVEEKVEEVVGPMGLKTPVVYGELSALLGEIRRRIETKEDGSRFDFSAALHPPTPADELLTLTTGGGFPAPSPAASSSSAPLSSPLVPPPLRSLLNETSDFLLSSDGALVLTLLLDRLLSLAVEKLEPAFSTPVATTINGISPDETRGARFEDVTEKQTRLASLLPVLTRLTITTEGGGNGVLRSGHGNEFIEAAEDIRELREFVAIVYASYDRDNLRASY